MAKKIETEVVGTSSDEQQRVTREIATGSQLTQTEQDINDGLQRAADQIVNRGEEHLQAEPAPPPVAPEAKVDLSDKYARRFCELSGYKLSDIAAANPDTLVFVTTNGGKYRISKKGTRLEHLSGPTPPAARG